MKPLMDREGICERWLIIEMVISWWNLPRFSPRSQPWSVVLFTDCVSTHSGTFKQNSDVHSRGLLPRVRSTRRERLHGGPLGLELYGPRASHEGPLQGHLHGSWTPLWLVEMSLKHHLDQISLKTKFWASLKASEAWVFTSSLPLGAFVLEWAGSWLERINLDMKNLKVKVKCII